jgi:hypothetical protein
VNKTFRITAALMEPIRNGHELADLIHETFWDALEQNGKKPNPLLIKAAQELMLDACSEEYAIATDDEGNSYYLIPVPDKEKHP